jgi:hypothetical protein
MGETLERDRLGGEAKSRLPEELRRRRYIHRLSTIRSNGRLRRGHMGERDHHDFDRHSLHRNRGQQQGRQIWRSSDKTKGTTRRGDCGPRPERRKRMPP